MGVVHYSSHSHSTMRHPQLEQWVLLSNVLVALNSPLATLFITTLRRQEFHYPVDTQHLFKDRHVPEGAKTTLIRISSRPA